MNAPPTGVVQEYYDARVEEKLSDFTGYNRRIEAAVRTLADWAPERPRRILEIGCGIGATSWRMARAWPRAEVIGADISPRSIAVAKTCFRLPNLTFLESGIEPGKLDGTFDLIVLMDVYEHIAVQVRPVLHQLIRDLLSDDSRAFVSVPTIANLNFLRKEHPEQIQPVDENIGPLQAQAFAEETLSQLLLYRQVGVWHHGDYAHFVVGRFKAMTTVDAPVPKDNCSALPRIRRSVKALFIRSPENYLGPDVLSSNSRRIAKLAVSRWQRRAIANAWLRHRNP